MSFNNDIDKFSIQFFKDLKNDDCQVRTILLQSEFFITIKYIMVHFEALVRPWWPEWILFTIVSLKMEWEILLATKFSFGDKPAS